MLKILFLTSLFAAILISADAQKGNNQIGIAAELGFPIGHFDNDYNTGYGGSAKFLWGTGNLGQLTFTTGYTYFQPKGVYAFYHAKNGIIPFLCGYRLLRKCFYIEPQIGYALYRFKAEHYFYPPKTTELDGAFTYALGIGFTKGGIDAGVRYQGDQGGIKTADDISVVAFHLGYNISLKSKIRRTSIQ